MQFENLIRRVPVEKTGSWRINIVERWMENQTPENLKHWAETKKISFFVALYNTWVDINLENYLRSGLVEIGDTKDVAGKVIVLRPMGNEKDLFSFGFVDSEERSRVFCSKRAVEDGPFSVKIPPISKCSFFIVDTRYMGLGNRSGAIKDQRHLPLVRVGNKYYEVGSSSIKHLKMYECP